MKMLVLLSLLVVAATAGAGVLQVTEQSAARLEHLDRDHTVVVLVGGILEEHGSFLPAWTDGYISARLGAAVAAAVGARAGWTALVFPQIPLGSSGANEIGGRFVFPGTYVVRNETLRGAYMDLADQLGAAGFHWILVVHLHGAPLQNRMLDDAGDYFQDTYGGRMVHLYGLLRVQEAWGRGVARLAPELARAEGRCPHVCIDETSVMLFLRPDLVDPAFRQASPLVGTSMAELRAVAQHPGWPGHFGTPAHATAEIGASVLEALSVEIVAAAQDVLDGHDERLGPRFSDVASRDPETRAIDAASLASEAAAAARQRNWLDRRRPAGAD